MPKLSIYVPDRMYDELRRRELPISQLAQRAFSEALAAETNADWIAPARGPGHDTEAGSAPRI